MSSVEEGINWDFLYQWWYRKETIYTNTFPFNFNKVKIYGSKNGGHIAVTRDRSNLVLVGADDDMGNKIAVYSMSGRHVSDFEPLALESSIITMGWNDQERLVIVYQNGVVVLYNIFGDMVNRFNLEKITIIDAKVWGEGVVCITDDYQIQVLENFDNPRSDRYPSPGISRPPSSWTVLEPEYSDTGDLIVYLAVGDSIFVVDPEGSQDMIFSHGPFDELALSPSGQFLACYARNSNVWIIPANFGSSFSVTFNTNSKINPKQMVWCGTDTVVCYWEEYETNTHSLLFIGPNQKSLNYEYYTSVYLISEEDGLRVIGKQKCEFIQKVPEITAAIFKMDVENYPGAELYLAYSLFLNEDPKADEILRNLTPELEAAVNECIEAAGYEFNPVTQKKLLRAASFGKAFLDFHNAEPFVEMAKTLRVLNALADENIGMPLTIVQYEKLHPDLVMERLINRNHHELAFEICKYLELSADKVLINWAMKKVCTPDVDQIVLAKQIINKLSSYPGISYFDIIKKSISVGRNALALHLLDEEPDPTNQVKLLIQMASFSLGDREMEQAQLFLARALSKATKSGNTDLVHLVLLEVKSNYRNQFSAILADNPKATKLWLRICMQEREFEDMVQIYNSTGQISKIARLKVIEAYNNDRPSTTILEEAQKKYEEQREGFYITETKNQVKLLLYQEQIEQNSSRDISFVGSSLSSTIYRCFLLDMDSRASKLRDQFNMPAERYGWIKLRALAEIGEWEKIEKWSSKAKGLGPKAFAEVCITHGETVEARKYIKKIKNSREKAVFFAKINDWDNAIATAQASRDSRQIAEELLTMRPEEYYVQALFDITR